MNDWDWEQIWTKMNEIWPERVKKMTDEQQATYRRALNRYSSVQVIPQLRAWAESRPWEPKPNEIKYRCVREYGDKIDARIKKRTSDPDPQEILRFVDGLTDEQIMAYMQPMISRYPAALGQKTADYWRKPWFKAFGVWQAAGEGIVLDR